MEMEKIARWTFVAGVIIAIVMGLVVGSMADIASMHTADSNFISANAYVTLILVILGIIVGFISVTSKEVTPFLIAAIALVVVGASTIWSPGGSNVWSPLIYKTQLNLLYYWATEIVSYIAAFAAPAAVIIAVRSLLAIEKAK
jgi:hypothetical protein